MAVADELEARAQAIQELHRSGELVIVPNAFDAGSARVLQKAGFATIATSSAAAAWSAGYADGQAMPFPEMLASVARVARNVEIPISADLENGFVEQSGGIDRTIEALLEAGAVGINLEDGEPGGSGLVDAERHAEKIAAAREAAERAGVPVLINGRTDAYWRGIGEGEERRQEATRRLRAYAEAGADCVFAPGLADRDEIAAVVAELDVPLNVMHTPATPPLAEMAELGVGRVSFGADLYLAALAEVERGAAGLAERDVGPLEAGGVPSQPAALAVMGL